MTANTWIYCPANSRTRIWSSPTFGPTIAVHSQSGANEQVAWVQYNANPPFSLSGNITTGPAPIPIFVGPPSPYVELWITSTFGGNFRAT